MVGAPRPATGREVLYRFHFPERPGALEQFLTHLKGRWSISLFHYRELFVGEGPNEALDRRVPLCRVGVRLRGRPQAGESASVRRGGEAFSESSHLRPAGSGFSGLVGLRLRHDGATFRVKSALSNAPVIRRGLCPRPC